MFNKVAKPDSGHNLTRSDEPVKQTAVDPAKRSLLRGRLFKSAAQSEIESQSITRLPWVINPTHFTQDCTRCNKCIEICDTQIISKGDGGFPEVSFENDGCSFCGDCTNVCEDVPFLAEHTPETAWHLDVNISDKCFNHQQMYCRACKDACDYDAIEFPITNGLFGKPDISLEACTACGACVAPCPADAISLSPSTQSDNLHTAVQIKTTGQQI